MGLHFNKHEAKEAAGASTLIDSRKPLLDLSNGSISRAALLTEMRLARSSDMLTIDDLKELLCERAIGLEQRAATQIGEQMFAAHGASFTLEQLVNFLVPVRRVPLFEELSDSEMAFLRTRFALLTKSTSNATITPELLDKVAVELPGLHDGALSDDERALLEEKMAEIGQVRRRAFLR